MREISFPSDGERCAAWHFPGGAGDRPRPCVVMAHGFGGTRRLLLAQYAERFAAAGWDALVFDYRHFGDSDGEPRQLLSPVRQLQDWAAAVACARSLPGVAPDRIALWGTSFSGGHVVVAGARDGRVAAVVSQCPLLDGLAAVRRVLGYAGPRLLGRLVLEAVRDRLDAARGRPPRMIPIIAPPGQLAAMSTPDAAEGYLRLAAADPSFRNEVAARVGLEVALFRPITEAEQLRCPWLVLVCDQDSVAPPEAALRAASLAPQAEVHRYPIGHFDIYFGDAFERAVGDQVAFLRRHLGG